MAEKRIIKPHKGDRSERINCRATKETKRMFVEMAEQYPGTQGDYLENLIQKEYKKFNKNNK